MTDAESFDGLRVGAFESRRADEMARMVTRFGGVAHVSPSMREVPLAENPQAIDFAHRLLTGEISIAVLMTGVGFRLLVELIQRSIPSQRFLDAFADIVTIARGPKPASAMQTMGITPSFRVAEPHTWREVLVLMDEELSVDNQTVAIQEYGKSNPSLIAGLEARGAKVMIHE
jgi:uroporphyrinogen-III synthase